MFGAVVPLGKNNLWIVRGEVVAKERGNDFPSCHSWDDVVDQGFHPLHVLDPFVSRDDPWLGYLL